MGGEGEVEDPGEEFGWEARLEGIGVDRGWHGLNEKSNRKSYLAERDAQETDENGARFGDSGCGGRAEGGARDGAQLELGLHTTQ